MLPQIRSPSGEKMMLGETISYSHFGKRHVQIKKPRIRGFLKLL